MYIIVIGGGNVGIQLSKRLIARGHEVVLVEKEPRQSQKLANLLGDQHIMTGDGCDLRFQKEAGFGRADIVISVTGEDEDNLVACQLAKEFWNVNRVIARVNDPSHESVFKGVGIDDTVSSTGIIFNLIEQQVYADELVPVGHLHKGAVEVVESTLSTKSPLVDMAVRDVPLPQGSFIVYIFRDGVGMSVDGDTVFQADDMVVALVPTARAQDLKNVLREKN